MFNSDNGTDFGIIAAFGAFLQRLPRTLPGLTRRRLRKLETELLNTLREVPEQKPRLPFVWSLDPVKQARARRWYFAAIARGEISTDGQRYVRTGAYVNAWQVGFEDTADGQTLVASNDRPEAPFVGGSRQVPSHERTGWNNYIETFIQFSRLAEEQSVQLWFEINDPYLVG